VPDGSHDGPGAGGTDGSRDGSGTTCELDGGTYPAGSMNPENACLTCQPGVSATLWSNEDGTICPEAGLCSGGVCVPAKPGCATGDAGVQNCGGNSESCCTSPEVVGGMYDRSYTNGGDGGSGESAPATVSNFRLDRYLVTVGRFRQFVAAWNGGNGYVPLAGAGKQTQLNGGSGLTGAGGGFETGWAASDDANVEPTTANLACDTYATWTPLPGAGENLPINCVDWAEAYAFCIWDGGFLPSEAEWEYAAAGGSAQREYPWGSTPPGSMSEYAIFGCQFHASGNCAGVANVAPVGTAVDGAGAWGQQDLAGDVSEWNLDWYSTYSSTCVDCAALSTAAERMTRGGAFDLGVAALLPPTRTGAQPTSRSHDVGFRCARTP
jgi:sulfatase modifying factor 1